MNAGVDTGNPLSNREPSHEPPAQVAQACVHSRAPQAELRITQPLLNIIEPTNEGTPQRTISIGRLSIGCGTFAIPL